MIIDVKLVGGIYRAAGSAKYHAVCEIPAVIPVATLFKRISDKAVTISQCGGMKESPKIQIAGE